ncbi:MAG: preprotein translocase subunit SecE [Verrucomicrobia bacterium]|nr:preprotein translocase subunit SecE [Verrucomicrobiota bacterium]MBS0645596.1 preprotein translocase subunit SecE [Verrucomicrobiota bacterium]
MDIKKEQTQSSVNSSSQQKLVGFMGEVKKELGRIEWTSQEELKAYTKIVVACMFAFGFSIYVIDLVIRGCLGGMNLFIKLLTG